MGRTARQPAMSGACAVMGQPLAATRMRILPTLFALAACLALPAEAQRADRATPGFVRVRIDTSDGPMVVALDAKRAPRTTANFLAYVDDGRFDGTFFYRSARKASAPKLGFIQGGIGTDARRILPSFPLETTAQTGILHLDGTISMARFQTAASAGGNFVISIGPAPAMDAKGSYLGYAAFGHVVGGMDTVKRILAEPTGGGRDEMKGQMILHLVRVIRVRRLDGVAKPTGQPRVWLLGLPQRQEQ